MTQSKRPLRAVSMITGMRDWVRTSRASVSPSVPGSIQSSTTRSTTDDASTCRMPWSSWAQVTSKW